MQPECSSVPSYQGSLYHKIQVKLTVEKLDELFRALGPLYLFPISGVQKQKRVVEIGEFLQYYKTYLATDENTSQLCVALSNRLDIVCWQKVSSGFIARPFEPVVNVKPFSFIIDQSGQFRAGMRGSGAIAWGIEFKFPMLFMDSKTDQIEKSIKMNYSNNALFAMVRKWVRQETRPSSFQVNGAMKISSFRIGK